MACGLPVVDVRGASAESVFGCEPDVIELADPSRSARADRGARGAARPSRRRGRMADRGRSFVQAMTWTAAADQIENMLRGWIHDRWEQTLAEGQSRSASVDLARR